MMSEMTVLPPNALVEKNGKIVTTSLKVSETFGKRHDRVLRAIKDLDCTDDFRLPNFGEGLYADKNGQMRPMYEMTRDGFVFLVMGFTGPKAARCKEAYITAFNQMEQALRQRLFVAPEPKTVEIEEADYYKMKAELAELKLENVLLRGKKRMPFSDEEEAYMLRARQAGASYGEIAKDLDRATGSVSNWFHRRHKQ